MKKITDNFIKNIYIHKIYIQVKNEIEYEKKKGTK